MTAEEAGGGARNPRSLTPDRSPVTCLKIKVVALCRRKMPITDCGLVVTDPSVDIDTLTKRQLEENVKFYTGSTIPDHLDISKCPHRQKSHGKMFDVLCKYWKQQKARDDYSDCSNPELLKKEFNHMLRRENCEFCFWNLLFNNLPGNLRKAVPIAESQVCENIFILRIQTTDEFIKVSNCIKRIIEQKEAPLTDWMWDSYETNGDRYNRTVVIIYQTQKKVRMLSRQLDRILCVGKDCSMYDHSHATQSDIVELNSDLSWGTGEGRNAGEPAQRHGDVWSEFE